ncbi:hypothetical protein C5167_025043 [Papaver somniferum]|uniref:Uncharacterized protein n=1 Tax=Papaver somniferum TaxID=3469 RepID=A0A4Y7JT95_PAPSO|nr:hypothetical protein C5167_025043 [Papaver somniferum]
MFNPGVTLVIFESVMFETDIFHLQFIRTRNPGLTPVIFEPVMFDSDIFRLQFIRTRNSVPTVVIFEPMMFNFDIFRLQFIRTRNSGLTLVIFETVMFNSDIFRLTFIGTRNSDESLNEIVGSAYYVAPEVILGLVNTMIFRLMKAYMRSSSLHKAALRNVESTITELSEIFTQLTTMVAHQGELAIRNDVLCRM